VFVSKIGKSPEVSDSNCGSYASKNKSNSWTPSFSSFWLLLNVVFTWSIRWWFSL